MTDKPKITEGEIILYRTPSGAARIEVVYEGETFWLNQKRMAELFGVDVRTISYHLTAIFASGELEEAATIQRIWRVQTEGNRYAQGRLAGVRALREDLVVRNRDAMRRPSAVASRSAHLPARPANGTRRMKKVEHVQWNHAHTGGRLHSRHLRLESPVGRTRSHAAPASADPSGPR
jgi:hypothetical protein